MEDILLRITEQGIQVCFGRVTKRITPGHMVACNMSAKGKLIGEGSGSDPREALFAAIRHAESRGQGRGVRLLN